MGKKYIDANALYKAIDDRYGRGIGQLGNKILSMIEAAPAADVAPVRHGKWLEYRGRGELEYMCSECSIKEMNPKAAHYCYHCGAKMDAD